MAVRFHSLTVTKVDRETPDAVAVTFSVPQDVHNDFQYKSGQYITVRVFVNGTEYRRNYSLCSSPVNNEPMKIAVKKVHQGAVSQWLNEHAKPGMTLDVYPPMGNFTKDFHPDNKKDYVMFAGGSGITPVLSIVKSILSIELHSTVILVYANRNEQSIMFKSELDALAEQHRMRLRLVHVLESDNSDTISSYKGRMEEALVQRVLLTEVQNARSVEFFVCGPPGMMESVLRSLHSNGVPDTHIHREYFTIEKHSESTMQTIGTDANTQEETSNEIVTRTVRVRLYGEEHTFEVTPDETILTAAQRANLDPPYACQIGACCTCRAKIVSGKVKMDEREALSDEEIAEGYALTCQSHPLTNDVIADYDQ